MTWRAGPRGPGREREDEVTAFVRARYGPLLRSACLLCGDHGKAEDLVQTTLAKTVVAWPRLQRSEGIDRYVQRVLVDTCVSAPQLAAVPPDGPFLGWSAVGEVDAGPNARRPAAGRV